MPQVAKTRAQAARHLRSRLLPCWLFEALVVGRVRCSTADEEGTPVKFRDGPAAVIGQLEKSNSEIAIVRATPTRRAGEKARLVSARESENLPVRAASWRPCEGQVVGGSRSDTGMESLPDLPAPDAAVRGAARSSRQCTVAVAVSAVAHGGAIGLVLAGQALLFGPRLEPPERGVTSIALVASVAAESEVESEEAVEFVATADATAEPVEALSMRLPSRRIRNVPIYPMLPQAEIPPAGFVEEVIDEATADLPSTQSKRPAEQRTVPRLASEFSPNFERRRPQSMPAARVATSRAIVETGTTASRHQAGAKVDVLPSKRYSPDPVYPLDALAQRLTGVVKVRAEVGADGRVAGVSLYHSSGVRSLDRAALEAVRQWRFDPAKKDGRAVAYEVVVPLRFTIVK